MSEISERIKSRLDRSKGLTQASLERFCGVLDQIVTLFDAI